MVYSVPERRGSGREPDVLRLGLAVREARVDEQPSGSGERARPQRRQEIVPEPLQGLELLRGALGYVVPAASPLRIGALWHQDVPYLHATRARGNRSKNMNALLDGRECQARFLPDDNLP